MGKGRPLAQDEQLFRKLYDERQSIYSSVAFAEADDAEEVLLSALGILVGNGLLAQLPQLVDGKSTALVADEDVLALHRLELAGPALTIPAGEAAKATAVVERLWGEG